MPYIEAKWSFLHKFRKRFWNEAFWWSFSLIVLLFRSGGNLINLFTTYLTEDAKGDTISVTIGIDCQLSILRAQFWYQAIGVKSGVIITWSVHDNWTVTDLLWHVSICTQPYILLALRLTSCLFRLALRCYSHSRSRYSLLATNKNLQFSFDAKAKKGVRKKVLCNNRNT